MTSPIFEPFSALVWYGPCHSCATAYLLQLHSISHRYTGSAWSAGRSHCRVTVLLPKDIALKRGHTHWKVAFQWIGLGRCIRLRALLQHRLRRAWPQYACGCYTCSSHELEDTDAPMGGGGQTQKAHHDSCGSSTSQEKSVSQTASGNHGPGAVSNVLATHRWWHALLASHACPGTNLRRSVKEIRAFRPDGPQISPNHRAKLSQHGSGRVRSVWLASLGRPG